MSAADTVTTAEIAKLLKLHDKNLKNLSDDAKKKYKNTVKAQKTTIQDMVEGVTTKRDYASAARQLASTIEDVKRFEKEVADRAADEPAYPKPKVANVAGLKTTNAKKKIQNVWATGPGYPGTPGPRSLGTKTLHAHITNRDAIAFYWQRDQLHVVGYGEKSGQAGRNDSGYKWET